jgi:hypothetical protein
VWNDRISNISLLGYAVATACLDGWKYDEIAFTGVIKQTDKYFKVHVDPVVYCCRQYMMNTYHPATSNFFIYLEDRGSRFLCNVGLFLPVYMVPHSWRL